MENSVVWLIWFCNFVETLLVSLIIVWIWLLCRYYRGFYRFLKCGSILYYYCAARVNIFVAPMPICLLEVEIASLIILDLLYECNILILYIQTNFVYVFYCVIYYYLNISRYRFIYLVFWFFNILISIFLSF